MPANLPVEDESDEDWNALLEGLRRGEDSACTEFWRRYGHQLEAIAQRQLSSRVQRRVGSEDVVQSACRTFFRRVGEGQFDLPDSEALWRLICSITLTKARRAARDQQRHKRAINREVYLDQKDENGDRSGLDLPGGTGDRSQEMEIAEQMALLLDSLERKQVEIVELKLQDCTNEEIATKLQCSERTVRRQLSQIQDSWRRLENID